MDIIANEMEEFPIRRLFRPFTPRVEHNPDSRMHGDVEVGIGNNLVHVNRIRMSFGFTECTTSRLGGRASIPVVIIISIEINLVDIPACIEIVAVSVEHDENV